MRLKNLEYAPLALAGLGTPPCELDNRANTCLGENLWRGSHGKLFKTWPQFALDDGTNILRSDVSDAVFQSRKRIA